MYMIYGSLDQKYKKAKRELKFQQELEKQRDQPAATTLGIAGEPEVKKDELINLEKLMPLKEINKLKKNLRSDDLPVEMDLYGLRRNKRGQDKLR